MFHHGNFNNTTYHYKMIYTKKKRIKYYGITVFCSSFVYSVNFQYSFNNWFADDTSNNAILIIFERESKDKIVDLRD